MMNAISFTAYPVHHTSEMGIPDAFSDIGVTYEIPSGPHRKPTLRELGMAPPPPFSGGN